MSNQILISSGAKLRDLDDVIIGTDGVLSSLGFDVPYGVPRLDANGKILVSELPNSVMEFKGVWDAATNTPTLTNGVGNAGDVYLCNVAGTVNFGAGPITFAVGDYAVYTGSVWARSSGAVGTVTSVAVSRDGDALNITGSPITSSGTINIGFTGNSTQYINGAGNLVTFPSIISEAQNLVTEVYNETGSTLTKGTIVYINGGHGNLPTVTKAIATSDATSAQTYGVVRSDITNNNNGYVTVIGSLSDLDTQAYPAGTQLYLSGTTAGTWTSTKPHAPIHLVYVGIVVRSHPTQGVVEIKIQNGYELDELHDVQITSPTNGNILQYDSATSLWKNVAGTTTNIAEGTNLYFTNARARNAISLTTAGSTGAATYDSATGILNIPNYVDQYVGTVTSVGLSAPTGFSVSGSPVTSSGTLALSFASGYSLPTTLKQSNWDDAYTWVAAFPTQTGNAGKFLTTDGSTLSWATNPLGTVTSVAMSVPTGLSVAGSPITTSGTLAVTFTAGYSIPTNASQTNWDTAYTNRITSATSPLSITSNVISINQSTSVSSGYLSSTDWNTFNNKQNALTNPVTGTGTLYQIPYFSSTGSTITGSSNIVTNANGDFTWGAANSATANYFILNHKDAVDGGVLLRRDNNTEDWQIINASNNGDLFFYSYGVSSGVLTLSKSTGTATFRNSILVGPTAASVTAGLAIGIPNDNAIRWRNAANTGNLGLYLSGANKFVFDAGIYVSGDGTFTSPVNVVGAASTKISLYTDYSGGNAGLSIFNSAGTENIILNSANGGIYGTTMVLFDNTNSALLKLRRDNGQQRGALQFGRSNGDTAQIIGDSDTTSLNNGVLSFWTTNGSGTMTSRMWLVGQNLGIGTNTPASQLSGTIGISIVNSANAALGLSNGTNHWLNYLSGTTYRIWNNTSNEVLTLLLDGSVLVGTNTGVSGGGKLQVNGNVNINGLFQINGVTIGGGGGSGVTGSGTTNYIAKWTSSSSLGNSLIKENSAEIQIQYSATQGYLRIGGGNGVGNSRVYIESNGDNSYIDNYGDNTYKDLQIAVKNLKITTGGANTAIFTNSNVFSIGSMTPSYATRLFVYHTNTTAYNPNSFNGSNGLSTFQTGNATDAYATIRFAGGGSHEALFGTVQDASGYANFIWQTYNGSYGQRMKLTASGNLLIGTNTDNGYKLQVNGDLYVSGSSVYAGGVTYSGVQTFNNTVNLNSNTNVAVYQNIVWKGSTSASDFSMGNGGAGMYILSSAAIDLNAPIVQRNGLGYSFAGTSSSYNVLLLNSGTSIDEITILGGVRLSTTTAGMIFPRMTTTQLNALSARGSSYCPNGTTAFDTTINILRTWNGSAWMNLW